MSDKLTADERQAIERHMASKGVEVVPRGKSGKVTFRHGWAWRGRKDNFAHARRKEDMQSSLQTLKRWEGSLANYGGEYKQEHNAEVDVLMREKWTR